MMKQLRDIRGFTLAELLVVMTIFLIIMGVTSGTFKTIVNHASQQSKSAETLVEAIVGLEVLRSDLKQAGFGLPWSFQAAPSSTAYKEAEVSDNNTPAPGFWPSSAPPAPAAYWVNSFNDAPGNAPRAILSAETMFNHDNYNSATQPEYGDSHGSKYLVIKSMLVGSTPAAKKWTNVAFANGTHTPPKNWGNASRDLNPTDRVVVVKNSLITTPPTQQLMVGGSGVFSTTFNNYSTLTQPHQDGDTFEVYGVDSSDLIMPFNRADYYVMTPSTGMPADCAPHTGILYKATLQHSDGTFAQMPLLDCVADMQVVYGLDSSGSGTINSHPTTSLNTAQEIREQLREIRVYILSHEGKKDRTYSYPSQFVTVGESFGGTLRGRKFDLSLIGSDWSNYRWKVHTLVVRPKNLFQ